MEETFQFSIPTQTSLTCYALRPNESLELVDILTATHSIQSVYPLLALVPPCLYFYSQHTALQIYSWLRTTPFSSAFTLLQQDDPSPALFVACISQHIRTSLEKLGFVEISGSFVRCSLPRFSPSPTLPKHDKSVDCLRMTDQTTQISQTLRYQLSVQSMTSVILTTSATISNVSFLSPLSAIPSKCLPLFTSGKSVPTNGSVRCLALPNLNPVSVERLCLLPSPCSVPLSLLFQKQTPHPSWSRHHTKRRGRQPYFLESYEKLSEYWKVNHHIALPVPRQQAQSHTETKTQSENAQNTTPSLLQKIHRRQAAEEIGLPTDCVLAECVPLTSFNSSNDSSTHTLLYPACCLLTSPPSQAHPSSATPTPVDTLASFLFLLTHLQMDGTTLLTEGKRKRGRDAVNMGHWRDQKEDWELIDTTSLRPFPPISTAAPLLPPSTATIPPATVVQNPPKPTNTFRSLQNDEDDSDDGDDNQRARSHSPPPSPITPSPPPSPDSDDGVSRPIHKVKRDVPEPTPKVLVRPSFGKRAKVELGTLLAKPKTSVGSTSAFGRTALPTPLATPAATKPTLGMARKTPFVPHSTPPAPMKTQPAPKTSAPVPKAERKAMIVDDDDESSDGDSPPTPSTHTHSQPPSREEQPTQPIRTERPTSPHPLAKKQEAEAPSLETIKWGDIVGLVGDLPSAVHGWQTATGGEGEKKAITTVPHPFITRVNSLSIPQLKVVLKSIGEKVGGKKPELVERVVTHFAKTEP
ncbi:hypothetical protein BLNAU_10633 [Blattamonas nauphoetae]|uniref:SAP domain-containing protein n=1 Tax=Blattamonas nauphoetae TaxID=2049346 RepID=A0ABQ9XSD7_9EUKA|nr:hypothetical protein BLNAU_10633 [Blattamonas nauphoetae]